MLAFVTCGGHQYTIRNVLETRGSAFHGSIMILSYRDFLGFDALPVADYILTDLERLSTPLLTSAAERLSSLRASVPDLRVLNAPEAESRRLAVSQRLRAAGINDFRVFELSQIPDDIRFPVFVRRLDDHKGPLTDLLQDRDELDRALAGLRRHDARDADLAVVEYIDTRDDLGRHQKRSYFRVADLLFPGAYNVSTSWVCKGVAGDNEPPALRRKRYDFLVGNEHEDVMREVFEVAGLSYGRADYAMVNGKPQVFEINTNPMVVPPPRMPVEKRHYVEKILANWLTALAAYSPPSGAAPRWVSVPPLADTRLPDAAGHIARRIVHRVLTATDQLHRETALMRPLRALGIAR